jgi:hypothetical protein
MSDLGYRMLVVRAYPLSIWRKKSRLDVASRRLFLKAFQMSNFTFQGVTLETWNLET